MMMSIERRRFGWLTFQALLFGIWLSQMQSHRCLWQAATTTASSQQTAVSFEAPALDNYASSASASRSTLLLPSMSTTTSAAAVLSSSSSSSSSSWPGKPSYDLTNQDATHLIRINRRQEQHHPVSDARNFVLEHLEEFLQVYKNRPDQTNTCGIRFNHALAIYTITKRLQPTTIIESGVNSGQSTYFFRQASKTAKIISIDPEVKPICGQPVRWIDSTNNEYLTGNSFVDFDAVNWNERIQTGEVDPANTLILIDDHRGFFSRFPTFVKYGFRHVMNEDNYKEKEGATRWDRANLTPKQMFRALPQHADTTWLFANLYVYAEFPPLLPPALAQNTTHERKVQGGFLHPTDDLRAIEEPLLRPDMNKGDADIFEHIAQELHLDATLQESQSYQEFMGYCFLAYMEIVPLAPRLAQAWSLSS